MIDLELNQNKIKEIKYEVKEGKTVIFKLQNSNIEDVEIIRNPKYDDISKTSEGKKEFIENLRQTVNTELDENEKRTLVASKKKEWEEDIKNHEIIPNNYKIVSLDEKYKDASKEEKEAVSREIIQKDAKIDTDIIKERNKDRAKDEYYKGDPNDEYSKIKSFGDVDAEITGKMIEIKLNDNNKNDK